MAAVRTDEMKQVLPSVTVVLDHYGLGYPAGYRPRDAELSFEWDGERRHIEIETLAFHREHWHGAESDRTPGHPGSCEPGLVEAAYFAWELPEGGNFYRIILDAEEISLAEAEQAVRLFFEAHETVLRGVHFSWRDRPYDAATDLESWRRDHDNYLDWLRRGAPHYKLTFDHRAVGDLLELSGAEREDEDAVMEELGYRRDEGGTWGREPDPVPTEPREWYADALRALALALQEPGPLLLSNGSWPTSVAFVASGKRHQAALSMQAHERAWFGYLPRSGKVAIMRSRTDIELVDVNGEPDIAAALSRVD